MNLKKYVGISFLLMLLIMESVKAQSELLYFQNYNNSLNFNPAYTGLDSIIKLGIYWQKTATDTKGIVEYSSLDNMMEGYMEGYVPKLKAGVAILLKNRIFGDNSGNKNQSFCGISYARAFTITNWILHIGAGTNLQHTWLMPFIGSSTKRSFFDVDGNLGILLRNPKIIDVAIAFNRIARPVDLPVTYTYPNSDMKFYRSGAYLVFQAGKKININDKTSLYAELLHTYLLPWPLHKSERITAVNLNFKHNLFAWGTQVTYDHGFFSSVRSIQLLIGLDLNQFRLMYNFGGLFSLKKFIQLQAECYGLSAVYRFKERK